MCHQQIAKLVGVAPMAKESGQSLGRRRIRGGRPTLRVALYMATLSAVRCEPGMKAHYRQLRDRGKPAEATVGLLSPWAMNSGSTRRPASQAPTERLEWASPQAS